MSLQTFYARNSSIPLRKTWNNLFDLLSQTNRYAKEVERKKEQHEHYNILPLFPMAVKPAIMELPEVNIRSLYDIVFALVHYLILVPYNYFHQYCIDWSSNWSITEGEQSSNAPSFNQQSRWKSVCVNGEGETCKWYTWLAILYFWVSGKLSFGGSSYNGISFSATGSCFWRLAGSNLNIIPGGCFGFFDIWYSIGT